MRDVIYFIQTVGVALFIPSIMYLWTNERKLVHIFDILKRGKKQCQIVANENEPDPE